MEIRELFEIYQIFILKSTPVDKEDGHHSHDKTPGCKQLRPHTCAKPCGLCVVPSCVCFFFLGGMRGRQHQAARGHE